jgi:hypothetical protein
MTIEGSKEMTQLTFKAQERLKETIDLKEKELLVQNEIYKTLLVHRAQIDDEINKVHKLIESINSNYNIILTTLMWTKEN